MFGNGNVIKNVLVLLLVLVRMYSYSAFSNVLVLIHHQCTRTDENVLSPRPASGVTSVELVPNGDTFLLFHNSQITVIMDPAD